MQTQKTNHAATEEKQPIIQIAPPTLVEEVLEETERRAKAGFFNLDRAADQAVQRVQALDVLRHAAIGRTRPIHWLLYKNPQGQVFARFNKGGAYEIGFVYGITVTPTSDVKVSKEHGERLTAEIWGEASSNLLGIKMTKIRAYRVEGEDFLGRPASDTERGQGDRKKIVPGVGNNDWLESVNTALYTKGVRLMSGMITVDPEELAKVWGMDVEDVLKKCTMGMGFSTEERNAASGGITISEGQQKRFFGIASGRVKEKGYKVRSADIVSQCIHAIIPGAKPEEVTKEHYDNICALIEKWEPGQTPAAPGATENPGNGSDVTPGQIKTLKDRANERVKAVPDAQTDGDAILFECIYEVYGDHRPVEKVAQSDMVKLVTTITNWGSKTTQGSLV